MSKPNNRARRRRHQRDPNPPAMRLTQRDKKIIEAVYNCRVLRQDQLQALYFGSQSAAQRRLALLFHHGFLARQFLPVQGGVLNSPILYLLDKRGAAVLRAELGYEELAWRPRRNRVGYEFLEHTLAINDVRVAVTLACQAPDYALQTWTDEHALKADPDKVVIHSNGRSEEVPVLPDAFFSVQSPQGRASFFLELDRGTMTTKRFKKKILTYQSYFRSGKYQQRFETRSIRVLTVTLSDARRLSLKSVTEAAGGERFYWFGVLSELSASTIFDDPSWRVAGQSSLSSLMVSS